MQALEVALGHRVEVSAANALGGTRALQPTKENLCGTRIGDRPLTQATLDLGVRGRLLSTPVCASNAHQVETLRPQ